VKLLDLIQVLSTKTIKKIAYSVLVLLIAVDFIIYFVGVVGFGTLVLMCS